MGFFVNAPRQGEFPASGESRMVAQRLRNRQGKIEKNYQTLHARLCYNKVQIESLPIARFQRPFCM